MDRSCRARHFHKISTQPTKCKHECQALVPCRKIKSVYGDRYFTNANEIKALHNHRDLTKVDQELHPRVLIQSIEVFKTGHKKCEHT